MEGWTTLRHAIALLGLPTPMRALDPRRHVDQSRGCANRLAERLSAGIISKDFDRTSFWFTISGQNEAPIIEYCLQLGGTEIALR